MTFYYVPPRYDSEIQQSRTYSQCRIELCDKDFCKQLPTNGWAAGGGNRGERGAVQMERLSEEDTTARSRLKVNGCATF